MQNLCKTCGRLLWIHFWSHLWIDPVAIAPGGAYWFPTGSLGNRTDCTDNPLADAP
ncbi:hypothetical protein [Prochlorothrix hollandica]|uniref:hypothetical protein n=1 Tax=Prochlorothrix hollandica TaxID=1223 RepID=UPI00034B2714|nr:hypothetical protein [Prochlorothrix hollandica]